MERFVADGHPVQAAFWLKTADEGLWFLYIATDTVDLAGPTATYRAVHAALQKLHEPGITSSEVKVISPKNPVARDVLAVMARHVGRVATRVNGQSLGALDVEQAYIYPIHFCNLPAANLMTSEDIGRVILRIMNRLPGLIQPSRVELKDGTAFNGVPFSIQSGGQKAMEVQFIAEREIAPRVVRLDEIASIV